MAKQNEIDREHLGRAVAQGWVWVVIPLLAVVLCSRYEDVRTAAGYGADYGRVANRSWRQVAREPEASAARGRWVRYTWYSAALMGLCGIALVSARKEGRRWVWTRRGMLTAVMAIVPALIVDGPGKGGRGSLASLVTGLGTHAALGGLAISGGVAAWLMRGSVVRRWGWRMGIVAVVAAGASGFVLAGWRLSQVEDLVRQPRDLAHVLAAVVTIGVGLGALRWRRRWVVGVWVLAVAAVVWTGVLMTIDGSDRTTKAWWLRGPVVQEVVGPRMKAEDHSRPHP